LSFYLTKTPNIVKPLASDMVWNFKPDTPTLYLTFDDGPVKGVTDEVLDMLDKFDAKATFFCVGERVKYNPVLFNRIINQGHSVGNHSYNHLSGWKTRNYSYFKNILKADKLIDSNLFRPPYGRITRLQAKSIKRRFKIIMWDVLSGDFDVNLNVEACANNVIRTSKSGSIIVFHDSLKAKENILGSLPLVLDHFTERGFLFKNIRQYEEIK
jgi:peptidoglycan/xylan/chitin deacetylase (PgdA/CDA1 family)